MRGGLGGSTGHVVRKHLAPDQYEANVKQKRVVMLRWNLPSNFLEKMTYSTVLTVDAKFPKDVYEHLQNAYEDKARARRASAKELRTPLKNG